MRHRRVGIIVEFIVKIFLHVLFISSDYSITFIPSLGTITPRKSLSFKGLDVKFVPPDSPRLESGTLGRISGGRCRAMADSARIR